MSDQRSESEAGPAIDPALQLEDPGAAGTAGASEVDSHYSLVERQIPAEASTESPEPSDTDASTTAEGGKAAAPEDDRSRPVLNLGAESNVVSPRSDLSPTTPADAIPFLAVAERQAFPGRLRFGRPSHATGMPGAPVLAPFPAPPDVVLDGFEKKQGSARCASVRGDDHRHYAQPRQDSAVCLSFPSLIGITAVVAVADGVGSRTNSHVGSSAVLRGVAEAPPELWELFTGSDMHLACRNLVAHAGAALERECRLTGIAPESAATTLVAAVIVGTSTEPRKVCVVRVGDSEAHLIRNGRWTSLFSTAGDEDVISSTRTNSLPADTPIIEVFEAVLIPGDIVVTATDGFVGTLGAPERYDFLAEAWSGSVPSLTELLWQVDASVRSYGDDRSVAIWWERL